ncbi:MAG: ribonuclease R family protein [Brevinemataceae bacterium]
MTHKDVIRYLVQNRRIKLKSVYRFFNIETAAQKKTLTDILQQLEQRQLISYDKSKRTIDVFQELIKKSFGRDHSDTTIKKEKPDFEKKQLFPESPQLDFKYIVDKYNLPLDFSQNILQEISRQIWNKSSIKSDSDKENRKDLRRQFIITIDGADSKDLDDAVSIHRSLFGIWTLGVHIADVSYYVPQGSALDQEALNRANSYYLIDKVIPMLPKKLSNDLCSLNPNEDKKTVSIFIRFNSHGKVLDYNIMPSTIKTAYRMTYDRVEELINNAPETDKKLLNTVKSMAKLAKILNKNRIKDGSIDFNFKEKKIKLDSLGNPIKVYQKDRLDSERLIEEFMLAANQAVGDFLNKNGLGLYRVHDIPSSEKYEKLKSFAAKKGIKLSDKPSTLEIQNFMNALIDTPLQSSSEIMTLRSMSQAVYQRENIGHFGLGFTLYAHFTSPIRRYADLVVHRFVKYYINENRAKNNPYSTDELDEIAMHISSQERIAMEAEREMTKIKSVRFMKPFEGQTFAGVVSSVTQFGIFVEIENFGIEALIRYSDMSEYMIFNADDLLASNRRGSKVIKIGDLLTIRITKVNTARGFIDAQEVNG